MFPDEASTTALGNTFQCFTSLIGKKNAGLGLTPPQTPAAWRFTTSPDMPCGLTFLRGRLLEALVGEAASHFDLKFQLLSGVVQEQGVVVE